MHSRSDGWLITVLCALASHQPAERPLARQEGRERIGRPNRAQTAQYNLAENGLPPPTSNTQRARPCCQRARPDHKHCNCPVLPTMRGFADQHKQNDCGTKWQGSGRSPTCLIKSFISQNRYHRQGWGLWRGWAFRNGDASLLALPARLAELFTFRGHRLSCNKQLTTKWLRHAAHPYQR